MLKKPLWIFLFWAPLLSFSMVGIKIFYSLYIWEYSGQPTVFQVKPGEGFSSINYRLKKNNLISNSKIFHRYSQVTGQMTKFKSGHYQIEKNSNMLTIIEILINGTPITIKVTFPEGKNIFEIGKILEKKGITKYVDFIKLAKNKKFCQELGIPGNRTEGYLYPNTYLLSPNSNAKTVIKTMVNQFKSQTSKLDFSTTALSKKEVIILASVVEKETGAGFERPQIAGVFLNRLKKGMRLQSDPTTIYGIYESFNGNLRRKHLQQKTLYNTYRINRLPVGPISNPGLASIKAVLNPAKHSYLYFVSQNDGTHIFTKTYKDHIKAVNKYQRTAKNRRGKSWRNLKQ